MLEEYVKTANGRDDFLRMVGPYFVNMQNNIRTLHVTGCPMCQYSKSAYSFISFNSLEEVVQFEKEHADMTPFRKCGNCFRKRH